MFEKLLSVFTKKDNNDISAAKNLIRHNIRMKKKLLTDLEKKIESKAVFEKIEMLPEFKNAKSILLYWSLSDELSTHEFIEKWSKTKQILLPVVIDDNMVIKPFTTKEDLTKSSLGIWEPENQKTFFKSVEIVIVPGVAFDKNKVRLGRGKGYYDKFFLNKKILKIGIGFDIQFLENIPKGFYDIKMAKVFTTSNSIE